MKYYGTKNNLDYGFYEENFENAIEITDEYWKNLLNEQSKGKIIIHYDNKVLAVDKKEYSKENNKWIKLSEEEAKVKQLKIENAIKAAEIQNELEEIDKKRIRALAEPSLKDENTTWLEYYNQKVIQLREELSAVTE